jgi:general secretion pathway protein A
MKPISLFGDAPEQKSGAISDNVRVKSRPGFVPGSSSYEAYYGLVEPPFSLTPGLRFTYNSHSHATALSQLRQALDRREGLVVVTGEVGTGKTMLCRALIQDTNPTTRTSLVLDPCQSAEEILEHVLTDFGVMNEEIGSVGRLVPQVPRHQMLILLQRFLASLIPQRGRAVIVIDEAQHLRPEVLEQIRLWSNFETSDTKLLQIVLAGQSELDEVLRRPEMRQIQQRITRRCELTPLTHAEVAEYIEHRLWVARGFIIDPPAPDALVEYGGEAHPPVRFTPAAAQAVASISGGIPRLVNLLCDRALEVGCEQQADNIDPRIVNVAASRLNLVKEQKEQKQHQEETAPPRMVWQIPAFPRLTSRMGMAAAAILLLAGGAAATRALPLNAPAPIAAPVESQPPAKPAETLQSQNVLTMTVATFRSEQRAQSIVASLVADGYPAFVRREPGGASYRLFVGPYVSAEAGAAARKALAAHDVEGTEIQVDNVQAGFSADVRYEKRSAPVPRASVPRPAAKGPTDSLPPQASVSPAADASASAKASADKPEDTAYEAVVNPAIERFERLAPFLMSAAASPSAPVLKALEDTLTTLSQSVSGMDVPTESRYTHQMLTSAISMATVAVNPGFAGNRTDQTRQALDALAEAKRKSEVR